MEFLEGQNFLLIFWGGHDEMSIKLFKIGPNHHSLRWVCLIYGSVHVLIPKFRGGLTVAASIKGGTCPFKGGQMATGQTAPVQVYPRQLAPRQISTRTSVLTGQMAPDKCILDNWHPDMCWCTNIYQSNICSGPSIISVAPNIVYLYLPIHMYTTSRSM